MNICSKCLLESTLVFHMVSHGIFGLYGLFSVILFLAVLLVSGPADPLLVIWNVSVRNTSYHAKYNESRS